MILERLPEDLVASPNVRVLLRAGPTAVMHKRLDRSIHDQEILLSVDAIAVVLVGTQRIRSSDGQTIAVEANELVHLPRGLYAVSDFVATQAVCNPPAVSKSFEVVLFFYDEPVLREFVLEHGSVEDVASAGTLIRSYPLDAEVRRFVDATVDLYDEDSQLKGAPLAKLKAKEFLYVLESQNSAPELMTELSQLRAPMTRRLIGELMEAHYSNNLRVADYAALTGRSTSTFVRDFRRLFGTSPKAWLIERRLSKARSLLMQTDLRVIDVAAEVGYGNVSHFARSYQARFGHPPRAHQGISDAKRALMNGLRKGHTSDSLASLLYTRSIRV